MIIRRVQVERYKALTSLDVTLAPGLNVIRGPNEAGKSTLHRALRAALYLNPKGTGAAVRDGYSWHAGEPYLLRLALSVGDDRYELEKDFAARSAYLLQIATDRRVKELPVINAQLVKWLGCPTEDFFQSTACVGQLELCDISQGKRELSAALQTRLAGAGSEPAQAAIDRLEAYAKKLVAGGKAAGQLTVAQARVRALEEHSAALRAGIADLLSDRARLTEAAAKASDLAVSLAERESLCQKNRQTRTLREELALLSERYARYVQARSLVAHIAEVAAALRAIPGWDTPALAEARRIRAELAGREHQLALATAPQDAPATPAASDGRPLVYLGLALMAIGLVGAMTYLPLAAIGALGLALAIYGLRKATPTKSAPNAAVDEPRRTAAALRAALVATLAQLGYSDEASFASALERGESLSAEHRAKGEVLSALLAGRDWSEYESSERNLALLLEQKQEALSLLSPFELDPTALDRCEREVQNLAAEKERVEQERVILTDRVARSGADPEALASVEEELAEAQRRLALLAGRRRAVLIAKDYLDQARQQTTVQAVEVLRAELGNLMATISDGRYRAVDVDPTDMALRVPVPGVATPVDVASLSTATREQCYLAARLSLVKHLTGGARPPLLLDDPFVNFDDERRHRTMLLLQRVAEEHQVLLFTCALHYDPYAAHVVALEPPVP